MSQTTHASLAAAEQRLAAGLDAAASALAGVGTLAGDALARLESATVAASGRLMEIARQAHGMLSGVEKLASALAQQLERAFPPAETAAAVPSDAALEAMHTEEVERRIEDALADTDAARPAAECDPLADPKGDALDARGELPLAVSTAEALDIGTHSTPRVSPEVLASLGSAGRKGRKGRQPGSNGSR